MCGLAEASIAASVISGVMTAYGQQQAGKSAKAEANYRAAIQQNNAIRAEYQAQDALKRGAQAEQQERLRGRLLVGQMRAVMGGSGQVVDEGSAGEMVVDQAGQNEFQAQVVRSEAAREAWSFREQGKTFESEAALSRVSGANAARNANFQAAGTLLTSGGKVASQWYQFKSEGVSPFGL